jgi:hypothetical protein
MPDGKQRIPANNMSGMTDFMVLSHMDIRPFHRDDNFSGSNVQCQQITRQSTRTNVSFTFDLYDSFT